ncbi:response regulator transcription factor [Chloroflexota bacterium]
MISKQQTIVIVEDDPDTAEMFAEMIRLMGLSVFQVYRGAQAIGLIAEVKPSAVILDWKMSDISGLEVMQHIRRDAKLVEIPIIMVSAKNLPIDIELALNSGASIYLTKPVGYRDLENAIHKVLEILP